LTKASPLNRIDSRDQITDTAIQSLPSDTTTHPLPKTTLSSRQNMTLATRPFIRATEPRCQQHHAQPSAPSMYWHSSLQQYHQLTSYRHDFSFTFDVRVGQLPRHVKRFPVHTNIFTQRSKFLAAARKPEWIAGDATKPVDLSDVNPDVFQAYLNCVYVGLETLEEIPGAFELGVRGGCYVDEVKEIPKHTPTSLASCIRLYCQEQSFTDIVAGLLGSPSASQRP
jgi:hypothetical protein